MLNHQAGLQDKAVYATELLAKGHSVYKQQTSLNPVSSRVHFVTLVHSSHLMSKHFGLPHRAGFPPGGA